uniref:Phosphatidylinositol transfer protein N-terminal domain-containing protein n=1 Tax=Biomphalaria glabrata TaxID=6526 RepID=A0A2C9LYP6_BIOGL
MLRAHRQAWCWQDEYYGLTLEDIRALERETQLALAEKMAAANQAHGVGSPETNDSPTRRSSSASSDSSERRLSHPHHHHHRVAEKSKSGVHFSETLLKDSPSLEAASDFSRSVSQESNASTVINGAVVASSSSPSVPSSQSRHSHSSQRHSSSEGECVQSLQ